ncbi:HK97 gp10 family phage protein [Microbacterium foliorum]
MRELKPVLSLVEQAAQDAMKQAARRILKRSNQLAPKDDGDLRRSGRVIVDDLSVTVRYTAPHAVFQHERIDWQHDGQGGAKFLEIAADETDIASIVAAAAEEALNA